MADEPQSNEKPAAHPVSLAPILNTVNWRELFPFLHLFRAFRVAVHPSKLILGLVALLVLYAGGRILDALWPLASSANYTEVSDYERFASGPPAQAGGFRDEIDSVRHSNQEAYAARLVKDGIETDADKAKSDAANFANASEAQDKIVDRRDASLSAADTKLGNDVDVAHKAPDTAARLRDSYRVHANSVAAAMLLARTELNTLRSERPRGIFDAFFEYESEQVEDVVYGVRNNNWTGGMSSAASKAGVPPVFVDHFSELQAVFSPSVGVVVAVSNFIITGPAWLLRYHTVYFLIYFAFFLLVWSIFGGAISRIAAVHVARDEKISVRQALRFSSNKVLSFIFAPLIPLGIVLLVGLLMAVGGLLFYIPWVGPILGGLLMILALLGGVLITLVLIGTGGGFNLMYPTIAAEGSDSFDAISRSFSYVYARPWRMLFYTAISIAYGALTYIFVKFFIYLVLAVTHYFVGLWLVASPGRWFPEMWPAPDPMTLPYSVDFAGLKFTEKAAALLICFWNYLLIGLLGAFVISFYFSSSTIIYYLMRREVDATDIVDVYVEETDDDLSEPAPVTEPGAASASPDPGEVAPTT